MDGDLYDGGAAPSPPGGPRPTVGNTHQVVQRVDPAARVVYADIDPMVAAQSAALLASTQNVALITADLRDPDVLLGHPTVRPIPGPRMASRLSGSGERWIRRRPTATGRG